MVDQVIYTPEAQDDVEKAYGWYEEREPGKDRITVYSIFHCSQNPRKWHSRLTGG
jgi:hypothetical protein